MSITPASDRYFSEVAGRWDSIRSGYFTEAVRDAAIARAYLRPDMVVADVGAGTGYVSAALAPRVRQVYVVDGSQAMLDVARTNLGEFDNLIFQQADGLQIPLQDGSLDAVFANMYLHHCLDPQGAIREMARLLRPGGRLVITDMQTHPYEWMKTEMADVWQGFSREQLKAWFREAGLVNVLVGPSGESCHSESQAKDLPSAGEREARVEILAAVGAKRLSGVHEAVRQHYGSLAESRSGCCAPDQASGSSCCGAPDLISIEEVSDSIFKRGYSREDRLEAPSEAADFSLGCGNPVAIANLRPGETVLDIGSGGGLDAFLSAKKVGPGGRVIGVDMTPAMLERARRSAQKAGLSNVEFRQGQAESLPVEDNSVDVILSNCVINLCEDKGLVFEEAARVLRPGGRLEISDKVSDTTFSAGYRSDPDNWGGCVYGALPEAEYLGLVAQAGFHDIRVRHGSEAMRTDGVIIYSITVSATRA